MIRERVLLSGEILSLEPEEDLVRYLQHPDRVGVISEEFVSKYMGGKALWTERYARRIQAISEQRERNIERAEREMNAAVDRLKLDLAASKDGSGRRGAQARGVLEQLMSTWAWALDGENPPPGSIAARCDIPGAGALKDVSAPLYPRSRL